MRPRIPRMSMEIQARTGPTERVRHMDLSEIATDDIRVHSEAPAEGDTSREYPEIRSHSQDPAEGPDSITEADTRKQRQPEP
jgi:hypothetical protein